MKYFSERETAVVPRESEEISTVAWKGLLVLIRKRVDDDSFGAQYPDICRNRTFIYGGTVGTFVKGTDSGMFKDAVLAEIPRLAKYADQDIGPILLELGSPDNQPSTLEILDLIEFCWKSLGKPRVIGEHPFWGISNHNHVEFDVQAGRDEFHSEVETIFRRNGIAYELTEQGRIERLVPIALQDMLHKHDLNTSDAELDRLLDAAHSKLLNPRPDARQEALEALWGAWERLKTLDSPGGKKASTTAMLDKTAGKTSPIFRGELEEEATNLTRIGNKLRIRHSEMNQEMLASNEHADYLFYRLYSLIRLIIRSRQ